MALKNKTLTKAMPKQKGKTSPLTKKKKMTQNVPKVSNPKQQSQLKTLFRASKFKTTPPGKAVKRQAPVPPKQRVWRKTILRTKPKKEVKLPKLFRADRRTGLPVDYERTVEHVMQYVNPYIGSRRKRTPEEELEEVMTNMFVELIQQGGAPQDPYQITQKLRSILQKGSNGQYNGNCSCNCRMGKCTRTPRSDRGRETADLSDFYIACKRGPPSPTISSLGPTRKSRFNYNQLKIKSI